MSSSHFAKLLRGGPGLQEFSTTSRPFSRRGLQLNASKDGYPLHLLGRDFRARGGRTGTENVSGRIPARHGRARGSAWRTGRNHPDRWVGGSPVRRCTPSPFFSRAMLLSASAHKRTPDVLGGDPGVEVLSSLDVDGIPPFDYAHEHFGYRDRLSEPQIEGAEYSRHPGPARLSRRASSFSGMWTRVASSFPCRSRKFFPEMAPSWLIADCRSMSAPSATFCDSMADRRRGPGADRGEVDGTLAERRTTRSGAREGRSSACGRLSANNNFNYAQMDRKGTLFPLDRISGE